MFTREQTRTLKRLALGALILCTSFLAVENTVLLTMAATARPWAVITVAAALFKAGAALTVPLLVVVFALWLGWKLPLGGRDARSAGRRASEARRG
jgi:hypothetical protein